MPLAYSSIIHLPLKMGGLNLPQLSTFHKKLQVSRQPHLLTSNDSCVRHMADKTLQKDLVLSRQKFTPNKVVRNMTMTNPGITRRKLAAAAKNLVQDDDHQEMLEDLQKLEKQSHMSRCSTPEGAQVWAKALSLLGNEYFKFALHSLVHTST